MPRPRAVQGSASISMLFANWSKCPPIGRTRRRATIVLSNYLIEAWSPVDLAFIFPPKHYFTPM
jgi:hypothetical protein